MNIDNLLVILETELSDDGSIFLNTNLAEHKSKVLKFNSENPSKVYKLLLRDHELCIGDEKDTSLDLKVLPSQLASIDSLAGQEVYLSLYSLSYRIVGEKLDQLAPLFFIPVKVYRYNDSLRLKLINSTPIFNYPLIKKLKQSFDLDLNYPYFDFQVDSYMDYIDKKVHAFFFSVKPDVSLIGCEANKLFAVNQIISKINELYLNRVMAKLSNETLMEDENVENDVISAYPFVTQIYDVLQKEHCVNISFSNQKLEDSILKRMAIENIAAGKSVSIYSQDDELLNKFTDDYDLHPLLLRPNGHNNYIIDLLDKEKERVIDRENHEGYIGQYAELLKVRDENFNWPFNQNRVEFLEELANYTALGKVKYSFDATTYSDEDYSRDRHFFKEFARLSSLRNIPINVHPFYGLTSRVDSETYKELMDYVSTCLNDVKEFSEKVRQANLEDWKLGEVDSFYDYTKIHNHFDILRQYSGFSKELFDIDVETIDIDAVSRLKTLYDSQSSARLAIDNIVSSEIWAKDLKRITSDYHAKKKVKKLVIKEIQPLLKIKDKKNLTSLFRLLDIYSKNTDEINENKEKLSDIPFDINGIDAIVELESAIEYIGLFHRHIVLYDDIDFVNNALVKKYFNDVTFRMQFNDEIIDKLDELASRVQVDFDNLYSFFDSAEKKDYEMMSFTDVIYQLMALANANYDVYLDYYNFIAYTREVSQPLKDVIDSLIAANESFETLEVDYFASVFYSYKKKSFDDAKKAFDDLDDLRHDFLQSVDNQIADDKNNLLLKIQEQISEYKNTDQYLEFVKNAKKIAIYIDTIRNDEMIKRYGDDILRLKPLRIEKYCSYLTSSIKTDISIIVDPEKYELSELLLMLTISRRVIFVSHTNNTILALGDQSVLLNDTMKSFHIDLKNILKDYKYPTMGEHLYNLVEYTANTMGYQIYRNYEYNNDIYPLVIVRPGVKKPVAMLFNDLTLKEGFRSDLENLFPIIHRLFGVDCFEFPLFIAALNPKELIREIVEPKGRRTILLEKEKFEENEEENFISRAEVDTETLKAEYQERLAKIRNSMIERPFYNENDEVKREDIDGYVFAILPISKSEYHSLKPIIKSRFNNYYNRGLITYSEGHFFPADLSTLTLRPKIGSVERVTRYELRKAIFTYLSNFTYMDSEVLINELASIIETDNLDLLRQRVNLILEEMQKNDIVSIVENKISLYKNRI